MLRLRRVLGQLLVLSGLTLTVHACTRAFGEETRSTSMSQPAERLGSLALLKRSDLRIFGSVLFEGR